MSARFKTPSAAVQLLRQRAADWKLDPAKIGILGFSAGGQVALAAATNDRRFPADAKVTTRASARFSHAGVSYQIYDVKTKSLRSDIKLQDSLPPMFITQSADDMSSLAQGSTLLAVLELQRRNIPCELHIYEKGGHGFGMRPRPNATGPTDSAAAPGTGCGAEVGSQQMNRGLDVTLGRAGCGDGLHRKLRCGANIQATNVPNKPMGSRAHRTNAKSPDVGDRGLRIRITITADQNPADEKQHPRMKRSGGLPKQQNKNKKT